MRYVMVTYPSKGRRDAWADASAAEKRAEIAKVGAWFARHRALGRIEGGEELGDPTYVKSIRKGSVTAIEVASEWPGLAWEGDVVELRLAGDSVGEADAQAAAERGG